MKCCPSVAQVEGSDGINGDTLAMISHSKESGFLLPLFHSPFVDLFGRGYRIQTGFDKNDAGPNLAISSGYLHLSTFLVGFARRPIPVLWELVV